MLLGRGNVDLLWSEQLHTGKLCANFQRVKTGGRCRHGAERQQVLLREHLLEIVEKWAKGHRCLRSLKKRVPAGIGSKFAKRALAIEIENIVARRAARANEDAEDNDAFLLRIANRALQAGILIGLSIEKPVSDINAVADEQDFAAPLRGGRPLANEIGQSGVDAGVPGSRADRQMQCFANGSAIRCEGLFDARGAIHGIGESNAGILRKRIQKTRNFVKLRTDLVS